MTKKSATTAATAPPTATPAPGKSTTTAPHPKPAKPVPTQQTAASGSVPAQPKKKKKSKTTSENAPPPPNPAQPSTAEPAKKKKKKKTPAPASATPAPVSVPPPKPAAPSKQSPPSPPYTPPIPTFVPKAKPPSFTGLNSSSNSTPPASTRVPSAIASPASTVAPGSRKYSELDLLDGEVKEDTTSHQIVTAPLITRDAFTWEDGLADAVPQYGVLGSIVSVHSQGSIEIHNDKRIYLNTNAPFSAVVCGVQGSGKSHTVGVLLESMLIPNDIRLGVLPRPLSALVLHFGESGAGAQPCEAAHQCLTADPSVTPPSVTVFVSPTQLGTMRNLYWSHFGNRVTVLPLKINHSELDAKSILSMMSVSTNTEPPLYVQLLLNILRELGENFTYRAFKLKLAERAAKFNPAQKAMCDQRLSLLESFLQEDVNRPRFAAGEVTVVDLTDPFIDAAGACSLFEIITRLFIRADVGTGKVLVVDEAHKYLTKDQGSEVLTQTLLSIVRQQRHLGTRLIMSTQEPTVVPEALLDLCSVTIMHRFSSITWFNHLAKHVSSDFGEEAFDAVVQLQTGQALVLAPAGLGVFQKPGQEKPERAIFGRRYLIVKTRRRVTADGGASILAV